jgi:hypothetical protein
MVGLLIGLVHPEAAAVELESVKLLDRLGRPFVAPELDEGKASGLARQTVRRDGQRDEIGDL